MITQILNIIFKKVAYAVKNAGWDSSNFHVYPERNVRQFDLTI